MGRSGITPDGERGYVLILVIYLMKRGTGPDSGLSDSLSATAFRSVLISFDCFHFRRTGPYLGPYLASRMDARPALSGAPAQDADEP
jgi:hypothetical protein